MATKLLSCIVNNPQKSFKDLRANKNNSYIKDIAPVPSTSGLAVANFLYYCKYSAPKHQLALVVLSGTPFLF